MYASYVSVACRCAARVVCMCISPTFIDLAFACVRGSCMIVLIKIINSQSPLPPDMAAFSWWMLWPHLALFHS